jgi:hypothetical protein
MKRRVRRDSGSRSGLVESVASSLKLPPVDAARKSRFDKHARTRLRRHRAHFYRLAKEGTACNQLSLLLESPAMIWASRFYARRKNQMAKTIRSTAPRPIYITISCLV